MVSALQTHRLQTLDEVRGFLAGSESVDLVLTDRESAYRFTEETLVPFRYDGLSKAGKGVILRYLAKMTGRSPPQVQLLVRQHRETGRVRDSPRRSGVRIRPALQQGGRRSAGRGRRGAGAEMRSRHARGDAADVRGVRRRALQSGWPSSRTVSSTTCASRRPAGPHRTTFRKTCARQVKIGERRKPRPKWRPGFSHLSRFAGPPQPSSRQRLLKAREVYWLP